MRGRGGGHPDPEIRRGAVSKKCFWASVWSKDKGGPDSPAPSMDLPLILFELQSRMTAQNLGPILGFSKNKLRFWKEQTPIFFRTNSNFQKRQTPISKNQTPIFKKINSDFQTTNSDFRKKKKTNSDLKKKKNSDFRKKLTLIKREHRCPLRASVLFPWKMKGRTSHSLKEKPWNWKKLYFSDLLLPRLLVNATFDSSSMALRVFTLQGHPTRI